MQGHQNIVIRIKLFQSHLLVNTSSNFLHMTFSLNSYSEYAKFKENTVKCLTLIDILHVIKVK